MCPPTFHHRQWPDLLSTCKSMSREHQHFRTNACFHDLFSHGKKTPLGTWKVWAAQTSGWWRKSCTTSGAWIGPNIAVKTCKNHMFGSPSAGFVHQDGVYLVETCNDFVSFKHTTSVPKYSINKVWWLTKKLLEELAKALNQVVVAVVFTKRGNVCLMTSSSMHLQGLRWMYPWKKHHRKRLKTNHGAASTSTTWVNLMLFFLKGRLILEGLSRIPLLPGNQKFVAFWAPETFPSPLARGHNKVVFHNEGCLLGMEDESEAGGKIMAGLRGSKKITPFRYAPL